MAAVRQGMTHITNAARLRIKESDRVAAVTQVLCAMGAEVTEQADGLTIVGRNGLRGGVSVDSHNDHRIAMMAAVAATRCELPVAVLNAQCVAKSYPTFWEDYEKLGGKIVRS
jgi:3-phosphoshikimate 1-carboxyvinyltransferase